MTGGTSPYLLVTSTMLLLLCQSTCVIRKESAYVQPGLRSRGTISAPTENVNISTTAKGAWNGTFDVVRRGTIDADIEASFGSMDAKTHLDLFWRRPSKAWNWNVLFEAEAEKIASKNVCDPTFRIDDNIKSMDISKFTLRFNCRSVGSCALRLTIDTSPEKVTLRIPKMCGNRFVDGASVGTRPAGSSVVRVGRVNPLWDTHPSNGREEDTGATIDASEERTSFYLRNDQGGESVLYQAPNITVVAGPANSHGERGLIVDMESEDVHNAADAAYVGRANIRNIALHRFNYTDGSSALCGHYPENAVDGIVDGNDSPEHYVSMTGRHGKDPEPYWQIDLGQEGFESVVKEIRVWNRQDGGSEFAERIVPFWIMLFGPIEGVDAYGLPMGPPRGLADAQMRAFRAKRFDTNERMYSWKLKVGAHVRWVRIQLVRSNFLQIAEVEVFAATPPHVCPESQLQFMPRGTPHLLRVASGSDGEEDDDEEQDVDPICYDLSPSVTAEHTALDLKYTCLLPGSYEIRASVPWFPAFEPFRPSVWRWRKVCTSLPHSSLRIDVVRSSAEPRLVTVAEPVPKIPIVDGVRVKQRTEVNRALFDFDDPTFVADGSTAATVFALQLRSSGETLKIAAPILLSTTSAVASPHFADDLLHGGELDDSEQLLRLVWRCNRRGVARAQISILPMPFLQPYGAVDFAIRKKCGGARRAGLELALDAQGGGSRMDVIRDGVLLINDEVDRHVFDGREPVSMEISLPFADNATIESLLEEREEEDDNDDNYLFRRNFEQLDVRVRCEPDICHENYWFDHPAIEILPAIEEDSSNGGGDVAATDGIVKISNYCTDNGRVRVNVNVTVGFYDTYRFAYYAECHKAWYAYLVPWYW